MASPTGLRQAHRRTVERRRFEAMLADDVADTTTLAPYMHTHAQETDRAIHEEIARLPGSLREPIILCVLQGLTYGGCPADSVCPSRRSGPRRAAPGVPLQGQAPRARHRRIGATHGMARLGIESLAVALPALPGASGPLDSAACPVVVVREWPDRRGTRNPRLDRRTGKSALRSMLLSTCKAAAAVALLAAGILATVGWTQATDPKAPSRHPDEAACRRRAPGLVRRE